MISFSLQMESLVLYKKVLKYLSSGRQQLSAYHRASKAYYFMQRFSKDDDKCMKDIGLSTERISNNHAFEQSRAHKTQKKN